MSYPQFQKKKLFNCACVPYPDKKDFRVLCIVASIVPIYQTIVSNHRDRVFIQFVLEFAKFLNQFYE